ncbi:MAG: prepilin-type N-terminal cleavage/methylation domain-containing protein, partial [Minisyncoccia bacterium]
MKNIKRQIKGFTLLEILLVIAAIGILAAIVLVAINPTRQIAQVRNAQRRSDINAIYKALEQYLIDNKTYPIGITASKQDICDTGTEQVGGSTDCTGKADLRVLVPIYLAAIPKDPSGGVYEVYRNPANN